jgi:tetratricopeptide (TPR) repeat protein
MHMTGRPAEVEAEYRRALEILQKLAAENPAVTEFRSELAQSHYNLVHKLLAKGRAKEAESELRAALAIQEKLAGENPAVPEFRSSLAFSHTFLGALMQAKGRPAEVEAEYRRALEISQKLADDNPTVPEFRVGLSIAHHNLANVLRSHGRAAEARDGFDRAIALLERLASEDPKTPSYLASSLRGRGLARAGLGEMAGAAADVRRALGLYDGLPSRSGGEWYETACCHAALAGLAGRGGSGLSAAEATVEAEAAMGLLHKAVAMGHRDIGGFRTEAALDPLRNRADFRLLMMDLVFPAEAFARGE